MTFTAHSGPGLWVRVQHRFGARMMEWFLSGHMMLFGLVLLAPGSIFDHPAYSWFSSVFFSESLVGMVMVAVGLARFAGLIINGARKHVTPRIRQISAGIGCLIWFGISYGFLESGVFSTWLAVYPLFALGELVNIHRAARDEGEHRGSSR
ncbi:hypothetical protein PSQ19_05955 [Devosia algicola]|uniref:Uncharacterized protein n=1 Tax=Devosia algicola TaxID=3026418 RepID=A0ABY7YQP0_9HYPH|nr:hypothetical protein [Devosia algicola]WDR03611.1 hypothetical protein PSQ19_05955 [Devosia algicola]